jgi:GT2 family glycosyltransferase
MPVVDSGTRWAASVVLFHSSLDVLALTMASLASQQIRPHLVCVHVNEDVDGSQAAAVRRLFAPDWAETLVVTGSAANHGFSGAHNSNVADAMAAGLDAALVLNPDIVLEPATVAELAGAAGDALAGPVLVLADPATMRSEQRIDSAGIRWTWTGRHLDDRQGEPFRRSAAAPYSVRGLTGACLWIPRAAYDRILDATGELFDEDFLAYREDAELGLRAERIGVAQVVVPSAVALHGRALRGTTRGEPALDRLGVQNRFLIAFKHGRRRPGAWLGAPLRDLLVIGGVLLRERHSLPGLRTAWRLRPMMRAKGRRVRAAELSARTGRR